MSDFKRGDMVVAKAFNTTAFIPWYDSYRKYVGCVGQVKEVMATGTAVITFGTTKRDLVRWPVSALKEYTGKRVPGASAENPKVELKDMLLKAHKLVHEIAIYLDEDKPTYAQELVTELDTLLHDVIEKV